MVMATELDEFRIDDPQPCTSIINSQLTNSPIINHQS